jgi:hypothetical protein
MIKVEAITGTPITMFKMIKSQITTLLNLKCEIWTILFSLSLLSFTFNATY